jgi:hypothetical protein
LTRASKQLTHAPLPPPSAPQRARHRDEEVAAQQMAAAIGGGDVSWGIGPDDEDAAEPDDVDWRKWIAKNKPTEKQQKLLDKIRWAGWWAWWSWAGEWGRC